MDRTRMDSTFLVTITTVTKMPSSKALNLQLLHHK